MYKVSKQNLDLFSDIYTERQDKMYTYILFPLNACVTLIAKDPDMQIRNIFDVKITEQII